MSVLRSAIDALVQITGALRKHRKITPSSSTVDGRVCVNLGCGLAVAPGWINVDASLNALFGGAPIWVLKFLYRISGANRYYTSDQYCSLLSEHNFAFHDLGRSLPFKEQTVDVFYSSHFFEHLFKNDALRLMKEMYRALRPGGVVRIAVPDLSYAISMYGKGQKTKMLNDYFFVDDLSSFLARHKYMYDFELLSAALREAGFNESRQCQFRQGSAPNIDQLDNRPDDTLYVEAIR